jgi:hypothetical protein
VADSLIPISDEQAKAIQEALKTLQRFGGFVADTLGTVPQDVIGLLGADWIKVRRAENLQRIWQKFKERQKARNVDASPPASLSVALPILIGAADESRDELQDIWARLLAAAADPSRAGQLWQGKAAGRHTVAVEAIHSPPKEMMTPPPPACPTSC